MNRQKPFQIFFCFCEDIRKNVCCRSQLLGRHDVSMVNDYADTCQHSQPLCRHRGKSKKLTKKVTKKVTQNVI